MEFRCAIYYSEKGIALVGDPYHVLSVVGASLGVDWVEIVGGVVGGGGGGGGEERWWLCTFNVNAYEGKGKLVI